MLATFLLMIGVDSFSQEFVPNYEEEKIPEFELPKLLKAKDGSAVRTAQDWENTRRPEIVSDFEQVMYGKVPNGNFEVDFQLMQEKKVMEEKILLKEIKAVVSRNGEKIEMDLLVLLPNSEGPHPIFFGLNFYGNQSISSLEEISLPTSWVRNNDDFQITENGATEESRGVRSNRWSTDLIIDRGYGLATMYYGDIDPDKNDFGDGVHALFYKENQTNPAKNEWGSIAGWAWGMSRAMDYFQMDEDIDGSSIVLMGHSRLGKAALWAGALDSRFSIVVSNNSGCGGAALSRRRFGETVGRINQSFPHWFCDNFTQFNNQEDDLPVDQHMLISLIAPRPVYVASAKEDRWADPKGEYLSAYYAGEVYQLYELNGIESKDFPPGINQSIQETIGYHIRDGKHDVTAFDWEQYLNFADMHFKR